MMPSDYWQFNPQYCKFMPIFNIIIWFQAAQSDSTLQMEPIFLLNIY